MHNLHTIHSTSSFQSELLAFVERAILAQTGNHRRFLPTMDHKGLTSYVTSFCCGERQVTFIMQTG